MRQQPLYLKLIFSFLILVLFIGLTELSLHIADPDLYYKNQFFPINRDIDFPDVYKKDANLFWRFRPDQTINSESFSDITYHINSKGMRGDEIDKSKKGIRILAVGNSCTFGWGVEDDSIWTTRLSRKLQSEFPAKDIEILNCGVPGYSSYQGKIYFEKELLKLNPDIVTIMFGWNDQWTAGKNISDHEQEKPNAVILRLQNIFSHLKIYQLARKIVLSATEKQQQISLDQKGGKKRVPLPQFEENLRRIIRLCKENNIVPILMVPPVASLENYFPGQYTISNFHEQHKRYQDKVIATARYEDIDFIDHQPEFDKFSDLFSNPADDPIHFNAKGHAVFYQPIKERIKAIIKNPES
ncbi:MAG: SGNH/GDSL hydrolase family protein [Calditrichaeota bacterium]|nr:MAG: SGNH/GDSL hydrolase family protein [Calditrichota bacterium]